MARRKKRCYWDKYWIMEHSYTPDYICEWMKTQPE